jgi:hypothetical protein
VRARLARFILGHADWFYFGIPILAAAAASRISILLGIFFALACFGVFERILHNANFLTAWIRHEGDDRILFEACRAGAFAPRRRYRWIPANPRCRLCLVPFGGVGKLVGIQPSQKNPEFCRDCIEASPIGTYECEVGVLRSRFRDAGPRSEHRAGAVNSARCGSPMLPHRCPAGGKPIRGPRRTRRRRLQGDSRRDLFPGLVGLDESR